MKVKSLVLAGLSSAVLAVPASAASIQAVQLTAADFAFGDYAATGLQTWQLWLTDLAPGESLLAIFGDADSPMTIQTDAPSFFNEAEFGQTHHRGNPALYAAFPGLQWDTYVVIGGDPGVGNWSTSPGFPNIALAGGGADIVANDNLAWFDGDPGTEVVESGGRILIGQLSFAQGFTASGTVSAQIVGDGGARLERGLQFIIPAPGALALLGVAGLVSRRRRG